MAAELKSRDRVLYFYGITESRPASSIQQSGVDLQNDIEALACGGVTCWISRVSAEHFERNLARNMENLDWLTTASVAHQRAISAIASEAEILPARFGTVFRNEQSLRKHISASAPEITRDFKRIKGAEEWGVKVFAGKPAAAPMLPVRSGKDYLKAKAAQLPQRGLPSDVDGQLAEFENALRRVALESAAVGNISRGQRGLKFQTSLLVKRKDRKRLESVLRKFSQRWAEACQIECTGPWPPYSFVSPRPQRVEQE
jgi:Gas vesicle synthesis protein GvpL/GvpF